MLNKEIPFLRIGFPICLGIVSGLYLKSGIIFLLVSAIALIIGFGFSMVYNRRPVNPFYGFPITYSFFLCGLLLYKAEKAGLSDLKSGEAIFIGSLSEYPDEKARSYRLIVRLYTRIDENESTLLKGSLLVYMKKDSSKNDLLPGDIIKIRCNPVPIVNRGNPYEFDYKFYMENNGIKYISYANPDDIIEHSEPGRRKLKHIALIIREKIIGMYKDLGITGDRLSLVAAITLGQKNMLDQEQKQVFINAGVMHIMAVSGLHAAILSLFIYNLLFFLRNKLEPLRIIITVVLLWCFAFITGLTPSVIRATLMFSFLQTGKLLKRDLNSINSVLASAVVILIIHPSVLFDAGFLLSYSAVIFIISFYQDLYNKISFRGWLPEKIWQSASVTILAQAGTLPLTISLFNRFPTWFLITNIIIVPLSSLLIIIGCIIPLIYPFKFLSQPLATILNFLTGLTEWLTNKASNLPFSTIDNIGMVPIEAGILFFVIFLIVLFLLNRKQIPVHYPVSGILIFLLVSTVQSISLITSKELIVYNTVTLNATGIRTGKTLTLYSDSALVPSEVIRHCSTAGLKLKQNLLKSDATLLIVGDSKILISKYLSSDLLIKSDPVIVIFTGSLFTLKDQIRISRSINSFILTSSRLSSIPSLQTLLNTQNWEKFHLTKYSGAFRVRL